MTLTEQILARASGRDRVQPGDNVWVNVDTLLTHDVCGPPAYDIFKREFGEDARFWDGDRVVVIPDHYIFTEDVHAHRNVVALRQMAAEQGLKHFYDVGTPRYKGVCHMALAEEGFNRPGEVLFGTDSHTCTSGAFGMFATGVGNTDAAFILGTGKLWVKVPPTLRFVFEGALPEYLTAKDLILHVIGEIGIDGATYAAMEFDGEAVYALPVHERMTLTNMAIEAGGKNGILAPDEAILDYVRARTDVDFTPVYTRPDAAYQRTWTFDAAQIEPLVAKPHRPDNRAAVREVAGTKLQRAYVGSCTGGKLEDFEAAARLLRGHEVRIPTFIVPATRLVGEQLKTTFVGDESLHDVFVNAGCHIGDASCGACLGGPPDTFGRAQDAENVVSTTNRNFPGRMGSQGAAVYLASPLTVAASALTGVLTDPRDYLN
ncbi:MAG: 3-isopropylmalate dehydratase large subunit [Rhodothermales bacterium]|nr:3-isopropylmalate dehydratase large subunit [Rhodothermales bacterium]